MSASHTFIDHTADILFEAQGDDLAAIFSECALALCETQVELCGVKQTTEHTFALSAASLERLLFDFLDELVFLKDSEGLLLDKFELTIEKKENFELCGTGFGDVLDSSRHDLLVDVKAITMHLFCLEKREDGWFARVLLDI